MYTNSVSVALSPNGFEIDLSHHNTYSLLFTVSISFVETQIYIASDSCSPTSHHDRIPARLKKSNTQGIKGTNQGRGAGQNKCQAPIHTPKRARGRVRG